MSVEHTHDRMSDLHLCLYLFLTGNRNIFDAAEDEEGVETDGTQGATISENKEPSEQNSETVTTNGVAAVDDEDVSKQTDSTEPALVNGDDVTMEVEPETGEKIADGELTANQNGPVVNGDMNGNETKDSELPLSDKNAGDAEPMDTSMGPPPEPETMCSPMRSSFANSPHHISTPTANGPTLQSPKSGPSPTPSKIKFRMMCQCGAKNCRKYLF